MKKFAENIEILTSDIENENFKMLLIFFFLFSFLCPGGDRERMTANHETYLLMASTQNDMEDWVKTIRRVIWAPFGGGQCEKYQC